MNGYQVNRIFSSRPASLNFIELAVRYIDSQAGRQSHNQCNSQADGVGQVAHKQKFARYWFKFIGKVYTMDCVDRRQQTTQIWLVTAKTSSVSSISPKRDLFVWISINRRYGESQLRKRGVPPGWGLDLVDFGKEFSGFRQYTSSRSARRSQENSYRNRCPSPWAVARDALSAGIVCADHCPRAASHGPRSHFGRNLLFRYCGLI